MPSDVSRRLLLAGGALVVAAPALGFDAAALLAELERRSGGRLGVAALDLGSGKRLAHRAEERFPMTSTFKMLAAAFTLARVDRGDESLERRIQYNARDLVTYSPVTKTKADGDGLTVEEICAAAVVLSDNTAGNLLLAGFGGPAGLTGWVRRLGDDVTRLDRTETDLNEAKPGDPRDTTSPLAMLELMRRILAGDALKPDSRERLTRWMMESPTGEKRIRAGVPKTWRTGDKTGSGENGTANDVAISWPPNRAPILVAAYLTGAVKASPDARNAVHAEIGKLVATAMA